VISNLGKLDKLDSTGNFMKYYRSEDTKSVCKSSLKGSRTWESLEVFESYLKVGCRPISKEYYQQLQVELLLGVDIRLSGN